MAIFRKVHTSIWSDSFFSELNKEKKLFYVYILTNEKTKQCGIYEITKKHICFDLGYSMDTVSILLSYFIKMQKIRYNSKTNELAIKNWAKYNSSSSPKVQSCITKELKAVKDRVLIEYIYSIDTLSQEEQEQEQEQEQEEEQEQPESDLPISPALEIKERFELFWNHYHEITGKPKSDKKATFGYWKKMKIEDQRKAYAKTIDYSASIKDTKYRKIARTYLSAESFNDEFASTQPKQEKYTLSNNARIGMLDQFKEMFYSGKHTEAELMVMQAEFMKSKQEKQLT